MSRKSGSRTRKIKPRKPDTAVQVTAYNLGAAIMSVEMQQILKSVAQDFKEQDKMQEKFWKILEDLTNESK